MKRNLVILFLILAFASCKMQTDITLSWNKVETKTNLHNEVKGVLPPDQQNMVVGTKGKIENSKPDSITQIIRLKQKGFQKLKLLAAKKLIKSKINALTLNNNAAQLSSDDGGMKGSLISDGAAVAILLGLLLLIGLIGFLLSLLIGWWGYLLALPIVFLIILLIISSMF